jgi:hypothetical protein
MSDSSSRSQSFVQALAQLAGFAVPAEDYGALAALLEGHRECVQSLGVIDLGAAEPILTFDPRWDDPRDR